MFHFYFTFLPTAHKVSDFFFFLHILADTYYFSSFFFWCWGWNPKALGKHHHWASPLYLHYLCSILFLRNLQIFFFFFWEDPVSSLCLGSEISWGMFRCESVSGTLGNYFFNFPLICFSVLFFIFQSFGSILNFFCEIFKISRALSSFYPFK